jgi:Inositol hexakisphosphate
MRRVAAKSLLIIGLAIAIASPAFATPDQATLIINAHDKSGLPRNYRATTDVSKLDGNKALGARLDKLQASASGQFSANGLAALLQRAGGRPVVVLDLRQESHGFVGGTAVSWFGVRNAANNGKSGDQISRDESDLLAGLTGHTTITVKEVTSKSSDRAIEDSKDVQLPVDGVRNEENLVRAAGANYVRVYAADYMPFTNEEVDQLVAFWQSRPADSWLHVHCAAGDGRTTQALALFDMLENAGTVSLKNIVDRQHDLGGPPCCRSARRRRGARTPPSPERSSFVASTCTPRSTRAAKARRGRAGPRAIRRGLQPSSASVTFGTVAFGLTL